MRSTFRMGLVIIALLLAVACSFLPAQSPTPVPPTETPAMVPTEAPPPTPEPTVPPSPLRLAFIDQNNHVCIIQVDGQGLACLTNSGEDSSPTWSPDGQTLAFIHREDARPSPGQVMRRPPSSKATAGSLVSGSEGFLPIVSRRKRTGSSDGKSQRKVIMPRRTKRFPSGGPGWKVKGLHATV